MIPKETLAHLPTPVEALPRLSSTLGGPSLWVKRDDQTGLALGGNKSRKLEYLLADARRQGARTLVTTGAVQSNHCRQTAAAAAKAGMDCILVLAGTPPGKISGNYFLDYLLGAEIIWADPQHRDAQLDAAISEAAQAGRHPYKIPYGGSNPVGAAAFAFAIEELLAQETHPDWIVFATSSGGTQAGMMAGARIFGYQGRILGISVDEPAETMRTPIANLAERVADLLHHPIPFSAEEVQVNDGYLGEGYGVMGPGEVEAIRLFAQQEGLLLDPVYTGRAATGLIDLIRNGFFNPKERVLFWHTGGTPALFADRYQIDDQS